MAIRRLTTAALHAELARREKEAKKLRTQREKLASQLETLDAKLSTLEEGGARGPGRPPGKGRGKSKSTGAKQRTGGTRKRARNDVSLPEAIAQAMEKGAVVSPKEAAAIVKKNGFKTTSKNFNMMVSNALAKDTRFKRLGRGQYKRVK